MRLLLWTYLAVAVDLAASARILAVLPIPAQSHHHLFRAVLKTLAERGHQIVSYTPLPMDKPVANYTEIHLDTVESVGNTRELFFALLSISYLAGNMCLMGGRHATNHFAQFWVLHGRLHILSTCNYKVYGLSVLPTKRETLYSGSSLKVKTKLYSVYNIVSHQYLYKIHLHGNY